MTTRILAFVLLLSSAVYLKSANAVRADSPVQDADEIPVLVDTVTTLVVDSIKTVRDQSVELKENLKDKVAILEYQQREIKRTQRKIDSLTQVEYCSK